MIFNIHSCSGSSKPQPTEGPKPMLHGHRSRVNRICVRLRRECVLIHKLDCHVLSSSIWTTIEKQNLKGNYQMTNTKLNVIIDIPCKQNKHIACNSSSTLKLNNACHARCKLKQIHQYLFFFFFLALLFLYGRWMFFMYIYF